MDPTTGNKLISMGRKQSQKAPFPPSSLVYVYNDHSPPQMVAAGEVTRVNFCMKNNGEVELFFAVKCSAIQDEEENSHVLVQASLLRFRNGCHVEVQSSEDVKIWIPAIVLGIHDVPKIDENDEESSRSSSCYSYQYSVQLWHGNDYESSTIGCETSQIAHGIDPKRVRFRLAARMIEEASEISESEILPIKKEEDIDSVEISSAASSVSLRSINQEGKLLGKNGMNENERTQPQPIPENVMKEEMTDLVEIRNDSSKRKLESLGGGEGNSSRENKHGSTEEYMPVMEPAQRKEAMKKRKRDESSCDSNTQSIQMEKLTADSANGQSTELHWRYVRPSRSEGLVKVVKGVTYYWRNEYNSGRGMWSANGVIKPKSTTNPIDLQKKDLAAKSLISEELERPRSWRYARPSQSEGLVKVVKGVQYHWRDQYNGGRGMWSANGIPPKPTTLKIVVPDIDVGNLGHKKWTYEKIRKEAGITNKIWKGKIQHETCILVQDAFEEKAQAAARKILTFLQKELCSKLEGVSITKRDPSLSFPSVYVQNEEYKEHIFGIFKRMEVNHKVLGRHLTSDPPRSPHCSKGFSMCLAYHVKGRCASDCKRFQDHKPHTDAQDKALQSWCKAHYKHHVDK